MQFLLNTSTDAPFNLALEELIATGCKEEFLMLWRNRSAVIVGRNQNSAAEVDSAYLRSHNIQLVRRMTGGGAVYHDLGNVNYTIAVNDRQLDPDSFARNASVVLEALRSFGVAAEFSGRNDIVVDGRKISGSAKTVLKDRTLFHGTLLFDSELSMLTNVLTPDPEKIRAKGIKSVRSRVANLSSFLPGWDTDFFIQKLAGELIRRTGAVKRDIPETLKKEADALADLKYRSWEWNYGVNTVYTYCKSGYFPFGSCRVEFNVSENRICDLRFTGDFFGAADVSFLSQRLNGLRPERALIYEALKKIPLSEFINGADADALISLFEL